MTDPRALRRVWLGLAVMLLPDVRFAAEALRNAARRRPPERWSTGVSVATLADDGER